MERVQVLEIRYSFWRLVRYLAVGIGALALSWYSIENGHWSVAILGWLALPIAGLSVADAIWRFYCATRGPDMTLSLDGIDVYGARIPWSAIRGVTAKREYGLSTIDLSFFPGDVDRLEFDFTGRIARWMSKVTDADGLTLSAFALQIEHDELVTLIEAFIAETQRMGAGSVASSPLDGSAPAP
jgi:hypothetical protein